MWNATWHNFNVIILIVVWIFRSKRFKTKVQYWHRNNNTSSILTKKLCLLKITWPKKVIPTKSYSLAMLHLHHKIFKSCTTPMTSQAIVSYFLCSQTFSIVTQYMSVSHGHSTICGIEWWLWRRQKGEDSLTSTRHISGLWRMPINRYQSEWVGIAMKRKD